VVEAARCAGEIQREIEVRNEGLGADRRMQFRVGVNLGDIIEQDDGTIYGDGVNVAARLQSLAAPGGIALSGEAHDMLEGKIEAPMRSLGRHEVKNIARPVRVYALDWGGEGATLTFTKPLDQAALSSIAVLPFSNLSRDLEAGVFAEGLVEEIIDILAQGKYYRHSSTPLKVASRTTSSRFTMGEDTSVIASALAVGYVLEGSVRRIASSMRITAQLIRCDDGFHVWSKSYDREMAGGFEMQTRLARNIAHLTTAELLFDLWKRRALAGESFPGVERTAVEHFLNAEYQYRLIRLGEGGDWALYEQLLRKAVEVAPRFSIAHTILAFVYMKRIGGRLPLQQAVASAHESIDRALDLSPDGTLALWQLGEIQLNLDLDYFKAESTFRKVLERSPDRIWMHYNLATIALREGRTREALRLLGTASALDAGYEQGGFLNSHAWLLQILGHYEQSLRVAAQGLDLAWGGQERAINLRSQATALVALRRVEEARPLIAESWELSSHVNPESHAFLFVKTGESERARRILDDVRDEPSERHAVALGELALGRLDAAFAAIEAGIKDHDPQLADSLRRADWWDALRDDPRYPVMVEKLEEEESHTELYSRASRR
jgi:adenylate cyclase